MHYTSCTVLRTQYTIEDRSCSSLGIGVSSLSRSLADLSIPNSAMSDVGLELVVVGGRRGTGGFPLTGEL